MQAVPMQQQFEVLKGDGHEVSHGGRAASVIAAAAPPVFIETRVLRLQAFTPTTA